MTELSGIKIDEVESSACVLCLGVQPEDSGSSTGRVSLCAKHIEKMRVAIQEINRERGLTP